MSTQLRNSRILLAAISLLLASQTYLTAAQQENEVIEKRSIETDPRLKLTSLDQKFCFFTTTGKYPTLTTGFPGSTTVETYLCGTFDVQRKDDKEKMEIRLVHDGSDLSQLVPIRKMTLDASANCKADRKYVGYRERVGAKLFEKFMRAVDLLPDGVCKKQVLFDQWKEGLPMKWVLRDIQDLKGIKTYLAHKFEQNNIIDISNKPLLVIVFANNQTIDDLDQDDFAFLDKYFHLSNRNDLLVKDFFTSAQSWLFKASKQLSNPKYVGETTGEMFLRKVEKLVKDFKGEAILGALLFTGITTALKSTQDAIKKKAEGRVGEFVSDHKSELDSFKTVAKIAMQLGGVALLAAIIYKIITKRDAADPIEKVKMLHKYGSNDLQESDNSVAEESEQELKSKLVRVFKTISENEELKNMLQKLESKNEEAAEDEQQEELPCEQEVAA